MENSKIFKSFNFDMASLIFGIIGLIWNILIIIICGVSKNNASDVQDLITNAKQYYREQFAQDKCKYSSLQIVFLADTFFE